MKRLILFCAGLFCSCSVLIAASRDDTSIRRLVAQWNNSFNRGDTGIFLEQFDPRRISVIASSGMELTDRPQLKKYIEDQLNGPLRGVKHRFSVLRIKFPVPNVCFVWILHESKSAGPPVTDQSFGVLLRSGNVWRFSALWPFLPTKPPPSRGLLDGSEWIPDQDGAVDNLVFTQNRFISARSAGRSFFPAPYFARKVNGKIVWKAELPADKAEKASWNGEVLGDWMDGSVSYDDTAGREVFIEVWKARRAE